MIDRILVPLDGSLVAEQILPHVRRLLHRHDSQVILVRAVVPPLIETVPLVLDALLNAARDYLRGVEERLEQQGVRVKFIADVGSPAGLILDAVEAEDATMVAMATHGETGLKRLLAGSVAQKVIKESPVPVMAVRPFWSYELLPGRTDGEEHRPMRNILFPLDGDDGSWALLPHVAELARLFQARVVLLQTDARAADLLPRVAERLQEEGVSTLTLKGKGEPAREILLAAHSQETDLIAMTSHASPGFLGFLSDGGTQKILHDSECPILIVRTAEKVRAR